MRIIIICGLPRDRLENSIKTNTYTLASLKPGETGVIETVDARDPQVQRLMVLGLVEGAVVEHASAAIGGDPIEFRLFGCGISMRREHAGCFKLQSAVAGG